MMTKNRTIEAIVILLHVYYSGTAGVGEALCRRIVVFRVCFHAADDGEEGDCTWIC